jgi:hypothetical protein
LIRDIQQPGNNRVKSQGWRDKEMVFSRSYKSKKLPMSKCTSRKDTDVGALIVYVNVGQVLI